jgi:hypothetical protein
VALTLSFTERFCTMEDLRLEVDSEGFTREVAGKPNARAAMSIQTREYLEWYTGRISGQQR